MRERRRQRLARAIVRALQGDETAAQVLRELAAEGDVHGVESLIQRLGDEAGSVRAAACRVLGQLGDQRAVGPLLQRLEDTETDVREAASDALTKLGEQAIARAFIGALRREQTASVSLRTLTASSAIRAVDPLVHMLEKDSGARAAACAVLCAVSDVLGPRAGKALCRSCLVRFQKETRKFGTLTKAEYCVCRSCGKAAGMVFDIKEVVAVLDEQGSEEPVWGDGEVRVNWLKRRKLFDFDRVDIVSGGDDDIMGFCVQVGNDMDKARRKGYGKMPVRLSPDCRLEENTLRNVKALFGEVRPM